MNDYPEVVKQIHNEFNIAGERLLQESLAIIEKAEKVDIDKAKRLNNVGFANNPLLVKAIEVEKLTRDPALMAQVVLKYKQQYPLHKFISNQDVDRICTKYKLVKGNTEQYTGFVPEKNLAEIEAFKKHANPKDRIYVNEIKFAYRHQSDLHKKMIAKLKSKGNIVSLGDFERFKGNISLSSESDFQYFYLDEYVAISKRKVTELPPFDICAPKKDMISNEKYSAIKGLFAIQVSVAPDPVVLYPVDHGFIIVTAWGDEASDPLVVNEQMN